MANDLLNEAERFLLGRWSEARSLEVSMESVRGKYRTLAERVVIAVRESHPELDAGGAYVTQFWGKGLICLGRRCWPQGEANWPPGFYIENLRLENLVDEESDVPTALVWIPAKASKQVGLDIVAARQRIDAEVKGLLDKDDASLIETSITDRETLLRFAITSKADILNMLATGDGESLFECLVAQFQRLAQLLPLVSQLLAKSE
jgi:hypothetical protein